MSTYELDKLLFEVQPPERWAEFKADPRAVVQRYRLTPEEAHAVLEVNATAMRRLGAQPYLLRFFTSRSGMSNAEFVRQLEEA